MAPSLNSYIVKRLAEGDKATVRTEKGAALEDAIVRAFCSLPGLKSQRRNRINSAGSCEIDILLYNNRKETGGLPFLPHFLLIECKNWSEPVGSSAVSAFAEKVRRRHLPFGILVAANGVTGTLDERRAAKDVIRQAFLCDERMLVVLTRAELESLHTPEDIEQLMLDKVSDFYVD